MKNYTSLKRAASCFVFIHFFLALNAQKAFDINSDEAKNILKNERTVVLLTGNKQFDDVLKIAFNEYWNVNKFEFVTSDQYGKMSPGTDYKVQFNFSTFKISGYNLTFSKVTLIVYIKKNNITSMIEIPFDDMKETKKEEYFGADISEQAILNKIIPYVMLMNSQLKMQIQMGNRAYHEYKGNTNLISTKKVFVQKEYFNSILDSTLLKKLNFKVNVLSSGEISVLLKDKGSLKEYAWLCFVTSAREISGFIIDLNTGELLNYASIDKMEDRKKSLNEKTFNKIAKGLNE